YQDVTVSGDASACAGLDASDPYSAGLVVTADAQGDDNWALATRTIELPLGSTWSVSITAGWYRLWLLTSDGPPPGPQDVVFSAYCYDYDQTIDLGSTTIRTVGYPSLSLGQTYALPGGAVKFVATGFDPGQVVAISGWWYLGNDDLPKVGDLHEPVTFGTWVADAQGRIEGIITLPAGIADAFDWRALNLSGPEYLKDIMNYVYLRLETKTGLYLGLGARIDVLRPSDQPLPLQPVQQPGAGTDVPAPAAW
ncbi:MAG: hypothetical protein LBR19_07095, partial [Bifidobacteriaceae bacterium]|nr:hypothetical protein [Bifidobacteriaceae bacterium]